VAAAGYPQRSLRPIRFMGTRSGCLQRRRGQGDKAIRAPVSRLLGPEAVQIPASRDKDFVPAIQAAMVIGRDPGPVRVRAEPGGGAGYRSGHGPSLDGSPEAGHEHGSPAADAALRLNAVLIRGITPPGRTWEVRVPAEPEKASSRPSTRPYEGRLPLPRESERGQH